MNGDSPSDATKMQLRKSAIIRVVVGLLVGVLVLDAVVLWVNWSDWTGCFADDDRVIDERAGLCYDRPPGWTASTETDLERDYDGPGTARYTSGLELDGTEQPTVHATGDGEVWTEGEFEGVSLEELAEALAISAHLMQFEEGPEIQSETVMIDGCEAATVTASLRLPADVLQAKGDQVFWVRVTVVDVGDGVSWLYSSVLIDEQGADVEAGTVADMDAIHDSLSVI